MLAILGGKGGCGKTTSAVGLGRAFARRGERVLLVDADCDTPDLHTVTDVPYTPGIGAACEHGSIGPSIHESPTYPGVDVLPAGTRRGAVPPAVLDRVREYPGRVVVDCPAGASSAVTAPARAADKVVVVSTPRRGSQRDAVRTVRLVRALGTELFGAVVVGASTVPDGPLAAACRIRETVGPVERPARAGTVGRLTYERLADCLTERNA